MKNFTHLKKEEQELMPLFDGAFVENKPIPFPNRQGTHAYSNLFYWAHLEAYETAEFPLHPHEGFEIMTFVLKGSLEHYDTASKKYTPVQAGGVQVTQAGSGLQHSEKIIKGSKLFQIWFDPDFSKSLKKAATYKDYDATSFVALSDGANKKITYLGENAPIYAQTEGLSIMKLVLGVGTFEETLESDFIYSYYLLSGELSVEDERISQDGFFVIANQDAVKFTIYQDAELFFIKSPKKIEHERFIERY